MRIPPKNNKFNVSDASERIFNGKVYHSKAERDYAHQLWLLRLHDHIYDYVEQPRYRLGVPENIYVADFFIVPKDGEPYVVDIKGAQTPKFKRDKLLWRRYGWCQLLIMQKKGKGFKIIERVIGEGRINYHANN